MPNCYKQQKLELAITILIGFIGASFSFSSPKYNHLKSFSSYIDHRSFLQSVSVSSSEIPSLKSSIGVAIAPTKRGITATPAQKAEVEILLQNLEALCPLNAPARDPRMEGKWRVQYTTAPPPSNGQLGPFLGIARQIINLENGSYINKLEVEPNEWLSAELRAKWFEWDGELLEDDDKVDSSKKVTNSVPIDDNLDVKNDKSSEQNLLSSLESLISKFTSNSGKSQSTNDVDYGATCWKVDFQCLSIKLFGISIVSKEFVDTSRIWRMSYLDDDVRIVRAGRTGKEEDDVVFYMTRE